MFLFSSIAVSASTPPPLSLSVLPQNDPFSILSPVTQKNRRDSHLYCWIPKKKKPKNIYIFQVGLVVTKIATLVQRLSALFGAVRRRERRAHCWPTSGSPLVHVRTRHNIEVGVKGRHGSVQRQKPLRSTPPPAEHEDLNSPLRFAPSSSSSCRREAGGPEGTPDAESESAASQKSAWESKRPGAETVRRPGRAETRRKRPGAAGGRPHSPGTLFSRGGAERAARMWRMRITERRDHPGLCLSWRRRGHPGGGREPAACGGWRWRRPPWPAETSSCWG